MPTVLRSGPCRFFFYAGGRTEPVHVHVERDENVAKFWLDPGRLQRNAGFRPVELRAIQRLVENEKLALREAWREYFES